MADDVLIDQRATQVPRKAAKHGWLLLIRQWSRRRHSRLVILDLSDLQLRDIGLTRQQALDESRKPFWR